LRCRVLAFLETAYYDDVLQKKERYESESIELVALNEDVVVGLLDIEKQKLSGETIGMIWHVATHPDFQRCGIGKMLLAEAKRRATDLGISRLEAWTRDTGFVNDWYRNQDFKLVETYYHIFPNSDEVRRTKILESSHENCYPICGYIHYLGNDLDYLSQFNRFHQCRRYDLVI